MRALARLPALRGLAHVDLGVRETPVQRWDVGDVSLLIKRDDLSARLLGGNKVRALELLLAGVPAGHTLLTVGATGSTHALAVARYGAMLGVQTSVVTWPQEEHAIARAVARAMETSADVTRARTVAGAYLQAMARRLRGGVHWVPAGGSVPLGAIGHVAAAMELAAQVERDGDAPPDTIVVPLGTGGTAAGLLVGVALAGWATRVVGVQVVPRIVASHARVARLARHTHALLHARAGVPLPAPDLTRLSIDRGAYGGAYGRETAESRAASDLLRARGGPRLESTYSAKAFAVALSLARRQRADRILFWLTFDGRWLP